MEGTTADLLDEETPPVLLHRDFFDKQVVVSGTSGVGFLDFDTPAIGEAALDIANMPVHFELRALQGRLSASRVLEIGQAFVEGYDPGPDVTHRCARTPTRPVSGWRASSRSARRLPTSFQHFWRRSASRRSVFACRSAGGRPSRR